MTSQWFVSDGQRVVGPVDTGALLSAIAMGRLGDDTWVKQPAWEDWRSLAHVREVRALKETHPYVEGRLAEAPAIPTLNRQRALAEIKSTIECASDESETITLALSAIVHETRASVGFAHRPRGPMGRLVTRSAIGRGSLARLGGDVDPRDHAVSAARLGPVVIANPEDSRAGSASLSRLSASGEVRGVALAPVYSGSRLLAILEVGHRQHAFRRSDASWIHAITRTASQAISASLPS